MSSTPSYTLYHPRWHRTRVSTYWWLGRRRYFLFILRELSSVFVAWAVAADRAMDPPSEAWVTDHLWDGEADILDYEVWNGVPHVVYRWKTGHMIGASLPR